MVHIQSQKQKDNYEGLKQNINHLQDYNPYMQLWVVWVYSIGPVARTENMCNELDKLIKHHSLHCPSLSWNYTPMFCFVEPWNLFCSDHHLLWLYLGVDHNPTWVQLHHHFWLWHLAHSLFSFHHLGLFGVGKRESETINRREMSEWLNMNERNWGFEEFANGVTTRVSVL